MGAFQHTAHVTQSDMLQQLAARPVIFRLHGLTGIPLQFLVGYLLLWLSRYREGVVDGSTHAVTIEESHMLASDKARRDIGDDMLSRQFRTSRKRGIALILCDQVPSGLPREILGNLGTRFVMRLVSAPCIWSVQSSMGLDRAQADAIAELEPRRAVVQYPLHARPFLVEVPELQFPGKPDPAELRRQATAVLAEVRWTESAPTTVRTATPAASSAVRGEELSGDARLVLVRLCEHPAESIEQRCAALRIDRGCEFRARSELDSRGYIAKVEQAVGGKIKFFRPTDKGSAWAKARGVRVKQYKSGVVHEYLLSQVERCIGLMSSRWRLQRNSSIARDEGLQPDLLVLAPEGGRFIVEVCCHNVGYDADNMLDEASITGIDKLVAVTPDKRTKVALENALRRRSTEERAVQGAPIEVFDAHECLGDRFDWSAVLAVGAGGD